MTDKQMVVDIVETMMAITHTTDVNAAHDELDDVQLHLEPEMFSDYHNMLLAGLLNFTRDYLDGKVGERTYFKSMNTQLKKLKTDES